MKQLYILLSFLILAFSAEGQTVQSSCTASDSIKLKYLEDAKRLALRKIYRQNLTYKDSIEIPKVHVDTVLNALMAVYNVTNLPARDTIISLDSTGIHTSWIKPVTNFIFLEVVSTTSFVTELHSGIFPTSDTVFNNLILKHDLQLRRAPVFFGNKAAIDLKTDSSKNLFPLEIPFKSIPGIINVYINNYLGDGPDITDSIFSDHVALTYSYGWNDCLNGCTQRRFWKFKVYFDCRVEYVGSYGDQLQVTGVIEKLHNNTSVYPNPFQSFIEIKGFSEPYRYKILNALGQEMKAGECSINRIENLEKMSPGLYFLQLQSKNQTLIYRVLKE